MTAQFTDTSLSKNFFVGKWLRHRVWFGNYKFEMTARYTNIVTVKEFCHWLNDLAAMTRLNRIRWCNIVSFVSKSTPFKLVLTCILLYGCETWTLLADWKKECRLSNPNAWGNYAIISYLEHETNDWAWNKINFLVGPQEPLSGNRQEPETCMVWACHMPWKPLQNHPSGLLWGWAMPWSAQEMLDGQHQTVDIRSQERTAHKGFLQKRLEEDLFPPHPPPDDQIDQETELNWNQMTWELRVWFGKWEFAFKRWQHSTQIYSQLLTSLWDSQAIVADTVLTLLSVKHHPNETAVTVCCCVLHPSLTGWWLCSQDEQGCCTTMNNKSASFHSSDKTCSQQFTHTHTMMHKYIQGQKKKKMPFSFGLKFSLGIQQLPTSRRHTRAVVTSGSRAWLTAFLAPCIS